MRKTFGSFFPSQGPPSCDHASPTLSPRETKTCPRTQRAKVFVTALFPLAKNRKLPVAVHKGAGAGTVTNSQGGTRLGYREEIPDGGATCVFRAACGGTGRTPRSSRCSACDVLDLTNQRALRQKPQRWFSLGRKDEQEGHRLTFLGDGNVLCPTGA